MKILLHPSITKFCYGFAACITLMLAGCGGGSPTPPVKLIAVSISPTSVSIAVGTTVGLNATGTYSNGKNAYITNQVTWTSASSAVATVGTNTGVVTGMSAGSGVPATTFITPALPGWTLPVVNITVSPTAGGVTQLHLAITRFDHTATLLPSSGVLVVGGYDQYGNALADAELYDPVLKTATTVAPLANGRGDHTATMLNTGKVLVAGGVDTTQRNVLSAELYDPSTGIWTGTPSLILPRSYHTATHLTTTDQVLLIGGVNNLPGTAGILKSAEIYTPTPTPGTGTWAANTGGGLFTQRYSHSATLLTTGPNAGKVLVVGGFDGHVALASVELIDPVGGAATKLIGSLTTARYNHTATLLNDGTVLVVGGSDGINDLASAELYDPNSGINGTWIPLTSSLGTPRYNHSATLLPTGQVQVMGGTNATNFNLASVELYTPSLLPGYQGTWVATHDLLAGRVTHTATLLPPDVNNISKTLVVGGDNVAGPIAADVELYW